MPSAEAHSIEVPPWLAVARAAKGFMPDDEGLALYRAGVEAGRSGLGPLLEIGTYCGKSAVYLGAAARESATVLFSVDHHRGSLELQPGWPDHDPEVVDQATGLTDTLPWARARSSTPALKMTSSWSSGSRLRWLARGRRPCRLLFIDGGHGEQVAWEDFRCWSPKVAPGGTLAIHDVFADPKDGGQVPYDIYRAALSSAQFVEAGALGSLRFLRRLAAR